MNLYVMCPKCELNYMVNSDSCCSTCSQKMRGKSINDTFIEFDARRETKLKQRETERKDREAFYAYRYNRPAKC